MMYPTLSRARGVHSERGTVAAESGRADPRDTLHCQSMWMDLSLT